MPPSYRLSDLHHSGLGLVLRSGQGPAFLQGPHRPIEDGLGYFTHTTRSLRCKIPFPPLEDPTIAPQWGWFEFIRKMREDQLSVLTPAIFDRRLLSGRLFGLRWFIVNWPDYIEHVLLDQPPELRERALQRRAARSYCR